MHRRTFLTAAASIGLTSLVRSKPASAAADYSGVKACSYLTDLKTLATVEAPKVFTEGPCCDRSGVVYFTNTEASAIMRWDGTALSVFRQDQNAANGLLFVNAADQKVHIYDAETGQQLHELPLGATTTGSPSMYEHDGRQYLLVAASGGGRGGPVSGGTYPTHHKGEGNPGASACIDNSRRFRPVRHRGKSVVVWSKGRGFPRLLCLPRPGLKTTFTLRDRSVH